MKKAQFLMLVVVFSFSLAGAAMAAGVKAPKQICLEIVDEVGSIYCLAVKSLASIKLADNQKMQHYAIAGTFYTNGAHYTIGGTGYMDYSIFRFQISGQFYPGLPVYQSVDGYVNLKVEPATGSMNVFFLSDGNPASLETHALQQVPCESVNMPD